ncbi:MAG: c-type cytochrome, partial [Myxococcota bacterium]
DGELLFEAPAGTGIVAPPVTYELDGQQYVAVMAGWGGAFALVAGDAAAAAGVSDNTGRLLVWKLGGTAKLPEQEVAERELLALAVDADAETVQRGNHVFHRWCATCHGVGAVSGGVLPDLRKSDPGIYDILDDVVLRGALLQNGMPRFDVWLRRDDVALIRSYLLSRRAALLAEKE